jgi:alpha-beta hydrolase superfamily lysophospholipase
LRLDSWVEFFVGHGFAVVDVDYRGSTGYGRAYRNALRGHWGVLDVTDCIDAVNVVGQNESLDLTRVVISGASAGGYTALRAATTTNYFRAATARSAIVDPTAWRPPGVLPHQSSNRIMPTFSSVPSRRGAIGPCCAPVPLATAPSWPSTVAKTG